MTAKKLMVIAADDLEHSVFGVPGGVRLIHSIHSRSPHRQPFRIGRDLVRRHCRLVDLGRKQIGPFVSVDPRDRTDSLLGEPCCNVPLGNCRATPSAEIDGNCQSNQLHARDLAPQCDGVPIPSRHLSILDRRTARSQSCYSRASWGSSIHSWRSAGTVAPAVVVVRIAHRSKVYE